MLMVALSKVQRCIFLNIASINIIHQHCHGFVHEIVNIGVLLLTFDNIGEVSKKHDKQVFGLR